MGLQKVNAPVLDLNERAVHRRYRPLVRRQMLIAAARDCILKKGLLKTSARDVAALAGVSVGTVAYHFESVDVMLVEVLRSESEGFHERLRRDMADIDSISERLRMIVTRPFGSASELDASWRLWLEYWAREIHDSKLAVVANERRTAWQAIIEQTIEDGVAAGEFPAMDIPDAVAEITAVTDGFLIQATFGNGADRIDHARARLLRAVELRVAQPSGVGQGPSGRSSARRR